MKGMKNKTIIRLMSNKIEEWLNSITDLEVQKAARKDVIVTGGSIASMAMGAPVNDFDVYFRTYQTTLDVANYYAKKFNSSPLCIAGHEVSVKEVNKENILGEVERRVVNWIQSDGVAGEQQRDDDDDGDCPVASLDMIQDDIDARENERYRVVFISENAITLSNKIQIVTRFYGKPDEIHRNYDFIHATCYYDHIAAKLVTPERALRAMQSKSLKYEGSLYPVCSLFRTKKFINRGWTISAGEILKMAMQISNINLNDPEILKEQLIGVDALYFNMLISVLGSGPRDDDGFYSTPYIIEVIDRIFGE